MLVLYCSPAHQAITDLEAEVYACTTETNLRIGWSLQQLYKLQCKQKSLSRRYWQNNKSINQSLFGSGNKNPYYLGLKESKIIKNK